MSIFFFLKKYSFKKKFQNSLIFLTNSHTHEFSTVHSYMICIIIYYYTTLLLLGAVEPSILAEYEIKMCLLNTIRVHVFYMCFLFV